MAEQTGQQTTVNLADQDLARMLAFSDGVFAFALTLLVLDIKVPITSEADLPAQLVAEIPRLILYVISFLDIGGYWYLHQRLFRNMVRGTARLLWFNLLTLFFITLLPASTSLVGTYPLSPVALDLYAANSALAGVGLWLSWWHAARSKPPLHVGFDPVLARYIGIRVLTIPVGATLALIASLINPFFGYILFLGAGLGFLLMNAQITWETERRSRG